MSTFSELYTNSKSFEFPFFYVNEVHYKTVINRKGKEFQIQENAKNKSLLLINPQAVKEKKKL